MTSGDVPPTPRRGRRGSLLDPYLWLRTLDVEQRPLTLYEETATWN